MKLWRWCERGLAALGGMVLLATITPLPYWYASWLAGPWEDPKGETLIVLGASLEDRNLLALDSQRRARYAVMVWREGGVRRIVVSGSASPLMRDYLIFSGVPEAAILVDAASRSTRENALEAAALLKDTPGSKVLLTSDYHMRRAYAAFAKAGLDVLPRPIPDARKRWQSWRERWMVACGLVVETAKLFYYKLRGWI